MMYYPVNDCCSCMEIAGEDPNCIFHGRGTRWAKENPDYCGMSAKFFRLALALSEMPEHTLWCVGSMEDGPFANIVLPNPDGGYGGGARHGEGDTPADALCAALAAATGTAKTPKAVECEASQSGGEAVTPEPTPHQDSQRREG